MWNQITFWTGDYLLLFLLFLSIWTARSFSGSLPESKILISQVHQCLFLTVTLLLIPVLITLSDDILKISTPFEHQEL